ncbi:MAG: zinc ribbon domain-containing protein [Clostridiales bacterium]|jgi:hypothetical protein|nr:zinc ribbon domain-containing protein [Clostridiales bacterium]
MKCYRCSTKNPEDAPYCRYCGAPLQEDVFEAEEVPVEDDGLLPPQEAYYEQTKPRTIGLFTRVAYRLLSSPHRYPLSFGLLAAFSICFILLILMLCSIGPDAQRAFALTGQAAGSRELILIREAQQAWQLLWSYLVVFSACLGGLVFLGATAYKMAKILIVFHKRKRTIEPIDWEKVRRSQSE